jgi:electron transfer flavoprotein alpha subunit
MSQTVLVIAEHNEGRFRKVTYEALSIGRQIAEGTGGELCAAVLGSGVEAIAAELNQYGAARTLVADDAALADYTTEAYTQVVAELVGTLKPALLVLGATSQGKDLAARLSARLNAALATDCIALAYQNQQVVARRAMYGGKVLADLILTGQPVIAAIRPNTMAISQKPATGSIEKIAVKVDPPKAQVIGKQLESGKVELTEADVVVSGGRGMGGGDYAVIEALAGSAGRCRGRLAFGCG